MTAPNGDLVILSCVSDFVNLLLYYGTQVYVCVFVYSVVLYIYCSAYILYFVKKLYMVRFRHFYHICYKFYYVSDKVKDNYYA